MRTITVFFSTVLSWNPAPRVYNVTTGGSVVSSIFPDDSPVHVAGPKSRPGRERSTVVTYYSQFCPHCWFFAVTFTRVANAIQGGDVDAVAVNCGDHRLRDSLCDDAKVYIYPTVLFYGVGRAQKCKDKPCKWVGPHDSARKIISWLEKMYGSDVVTHPKALARGAHFSKKHIVRPMDPPGVDGWAGMQEYATTYDRWNNALAAFVHALKNHYRPELHSEAAEVVDFVVATLPGNRGALDDLADHVAKKTFQSRKEMSDMLDDWVARWQISTELAPCKTQTCALWTLFHVSAAANAVHMKQEATVGRGASPEETLGFVRTMVEHFFGCQECMDHFKRMYASSSRQAAHSGRDVVLWLWEAHQRVNLRVAREQNVDEDRRWPSYTVCPACWRSEVVTGGMVSERRNLAGDGQADGVKRELGDVAWSDLRAPFDVGNIYMLLLQNYVGLENIKKESLERV